MRSPCVCAVSILLAMLPSLAQAQAPEVAGIVPSGGQRGTSVELHVQGKSLKGASVLLSGEGVSVRSVTPNAAGDQAVVQLDIVSDAPLGPREIRLTSPDGVSGPAHLWVDPYPQIVSNGANRDLAHAQQIDHAPLVAAGSIAASGDRAVFSFAATAGETWVFDVNAARIRSPLDPVLELRDSDGHLLDTAQSFWENDPHLIHRFSSSGRFTITLRDTQFLGGPDFAYRLTLGLCPAVTGYLPRGAQVGHAERLDVKGINLNGIDHVDIPAGPRENVSGTCWIAAMTSHGPTLPICLISSPYPVSAVTPGAIPMQAPAAPFCLDGAFERTSQARFRVHVPSTAKLVIDLLGRRINSRIDGALRVLDSAGHELAANDDAIGKDARLEFAPPAVGDYLIEVSNVEAKTGPDCFYRLNVHTAAPDFQMMLDTDRLQVSEDGSSIVTVITERIEGFDGPINVEATRLPDGVQWSAGVIPAGQDRAEFTLTTRPGLKLNVTGIGLRGRAVIGGKPVLREVVSRESYLPRSIDPAMFTDDSYRRPFRICEIMPLAVTARAEPFALETDRRSLTLPPGQKTQIVVRARRRPGASGEIKIEIHGLPARVSADTPSIAANQTEAHITLTAEADAPLTSVNLVVVGHLDQSTQPAAAVELSVQH